MLDCIYNNLLSLLETREQKRGYPHAAFGQSRRDATPHEEAKTRCF